jgi:cytochrome c peroxidase
MKCRLSSAALRGVLAGVLSLSAQVSANDERDRTPGHRHASAEDPLDGERLFERETFGGNGRTCLTCHSRETGTVSPRDARKRFRANPDDALFLHDGSDDGQGHGVTRMLERATILVEIPLPSNVSLRDDPGARSVVLRRGIPTTLDTPALDPVLMLDGRAPDLEAQAEDAIRGHAQNTIVPSDAELAAIADFQQTNRFFSSKALKKFARGGPPPGLPYGHTPAEKRGRRFFEDLPPEEATGKAGLCGECHSGVLMNETNASLPIGVPPGTRFQSVLVSELNTLGNPVHEFVFEEPDGSENVIVSADPGRALITGVGHDFIFGDNVNAFKISPLRGIARTAPYFHDNSALTLEEVAAHYAVFFAIVTDPDGPAGPLAPGIVLTPEDQADIVAFMKLL